MNGSPRRTSNITKARERAEAGNQTAAVLILADVEKHGGEQSLAVRWARAVAQGQNDAAPFTLTAPSGAVRQREASLRGSR